MNPTQSRPQTAFPSRVSGHSETEMLLEWADGSRYALPYVELRFYCPCAGCVDEHTGERTIQRASIPPQIKPTGAQVVGRYALQVSWNDGHNTGMYHFDRLLELCQKQGRKL